MLGGTDEKCLAHVKAMKGGENMSNERSNVWIPASPACLLGAYRMAVAFKDCVTVIHGPVGCHFGPNFIEIASNNTLFNAYSSAIRDRSVIYGGIQNLKRTINTIRKYYKGKKVIVLSAHVPSIIGDDLSGIDADICIDCGSFEPMWYGMEKFLEGLWELIEKKGEAEKEGARGEGKREQTKRKNLVNLIGFQRDVVCAEEDLAELKYILRACGIDVNVIPEEMRRLGGAKHANLNVVFGYGVRLAEKMRREYGIPYIVAEYPYGYEGIRRFVAKIGEYCEISERALEKVFNEIMQKLRYYRNYLHLFYELPVFIAGDLPRVSGMSKFLTDELGADVECSYIKCKSIANYDVESAELVYDNNAFAQKLSIETEFESSAKTMEISRRENNSPELDLERERGCFVLFGTDEERKILRDTIVFAFPSFTRFSFVPYLGRGVLNLIADIYERAVKWLY